MNGDSLPSRPGSGEEWRRTVEALWDDVTDLREEHARNRRRAGSPAATTKEIAEAIGVSDRTLGDWLRKRSVVPDWYGLRKVVEYLDGDAREWLPRWQQAKAAYDSRPRGRTTPALPVGRNGPPDLVLVPVPVIAPEPADVPRPAAPSRGPRRRRAVTLVLSLVVLLAVAAVVVAVRTWPRTHDGNRPNAWQTTIRNTWSTAKGRDVGVITSSDPTRPRRDGPAYFLGTSVRVVCQDRRGYPVTDASQGRTSAVWDKLDSGFWISDLYTDLPKDPPPGLPTCG